jgi:hypothetical protein
MQKGHLLLFKCQKCSNPVNFSIFELENGEEGVACTECGLVYDFSDESLQRQLKKFENLCLQIQESEEILSNSSIGIYLGDREIKIPYKILLSRLNSTLDLKMGEQTLSIVFRIEPTLDLNNLNKK